MIGNLLDFGMICEDVLRYMLCLTSEGFIDITLQGSIRVWVKHVNQARDILCCVRNDDCLKSLISHNN